MGSGSATPADELVELRLKLRDTICNEFTLTLKSSVYALSPKTDIVLFDFGGILPGNSLMEDQSRELITYAQDHPSCLVLVVSEFTFTGAVRPEMQSLGLDGLHNLHLWKTYSQEPLPAWPGIVPSSADEMGLSRRSAVNKAFFRPIEDFISWMAEKYGDWSILDVGAGTGLLSALLRAVGHECITAIDMRLDESAIFNIEEANILDYKIQADGPKVVAIFGRPCHGNFFALGAMHLLGYERVKEVLYAGVLKNLESDLAPLVESPSYHVELIKFGIGHDDEVLIKVTLA